MDIIIHTNYIVYIFGLKFYKLKYYFLCNYIKDYVEVLGVHFEK